MLKIAVLLGVLMQIGSVSAAELPALDWTPRPDWIDVTAERFGAIGDGVADDTQAIQSAINACDKVGSTVVLPPGVYRVTRSLSLVGNVTDPKQPRRFAIQILGYGSETTIVWDGPEDCVLFEVNGNPAGVYMGLTIDGRQRLGDAFRHDNTVFFEHGLRWRYMHFKNLRGAGVRSVDESSHIAISEPSFENCIFQNCDIGVFLATYDDFNFTFTGCDFIGCNYGIYNQKGNFYVRNSYFFGSRSADVKSVATGTPGSSLRRCVSKQSNMFYEAGHFVSFDAIEDCYIADWKDEAGAVQFPALLSTMITNTRFVGGPRKGPAISGSWQPGFTPSLILCNTSAQGRELFELPESTGVYCVPNGTISPNVSRSGARIDSFVSRDIPQGISGTLIDVTAAPYGVTPDDASDDDASGINRAIADADEIEGSVVYLPPGKYHVGSPIRIDGDHFTVSGSTPRGVVIDVLPQFEGHVVEVGLKRGADDVMIRYLTIGFDLTVPGREVADIRHGNAGSGKSTVTYDGVLLYGQYAADYPEHRGILFENLGNDSAVNIEHLHGNIRVQECSGATLLFGQSYEGAITVRDRTATDRLSGVLGFQSRLSTNHYFAVNLYDNTGIVMTDWYHEQAMSGIQLFGAPPAAPEATARVSINCPKIQYWDTYAASYPRAGQKIEPPPVYLKVHGPDSDEGGAVTDYAGQILLRGGFFSPIYAYPIDIEPRQVTDGRRLDVVLVGTEHYNASLIMDEQTAEHVASIGASGTQEHRPDDRFTNRQLRAVRLMVDDFQRVETSIWSSTFRISSTKCIGVALVRINCSI